MFRVYCVLFALFILLCGPARVSYAQVASAPSGYSVITNDSETTEKPKDNRKQVNIAIVLPIIGSNKGSGGRLNASIPIIEKELESRENNMEFSRKFNFNIKIYDDGCTVRGAYRVAKQIVAYNQNSRKDDDIHFVIGHYCSSATVVGAKIYANNGIIQISPYSTRSDITERGFKHFFRLAGRNDRHAEQAGDRIAQFAQDRKIAVIYGYEGYGRDLSNRVSHILERGYICTDVEIDLKYALVKTRKQNKRSRLCQPFLDKNDPKFKAYRGKIDTKMPNNEKGFKDVARYLAQNNIGVVYYGGYFQNLIKLLSEVEALDAKILFFAADTIQNREFWEYSYAASRDKKNPIGENVLFTLTRDYSRDITDRTKNALKRILNKNAQELQRGNRASTQALSGRFAVKDRTFQIRSRFMRHYQDEFDEFPDLYVLRLFAALQIVQNLIIDPEGKAGLPDVIDCDTSIENISVAAYRPEDCAEGSLGRRYADMIAWVEGVSIHMRDLGINPYSDYVGFDTVIGAVNFDESGDWSNAEYQVYKWVNRNIDRSWLEEPEDTDSKGNKLRNFIGDRGDFVRIF